MQRNQGMFDVHSSCRLSPDLKIVPVGVEELMESLAVTPVHNNNNNNMTTAQITGYFTPHTAVLCQCFGRQKLEARKTV